ncbi:hypothetical protein ACU4GD_25530 [Cupriavidus basilensis]
MRSALLRTAQAPVQVLEPDWRDNFLGGHHGSQRGADPDDGRHLRPDLRVFHGRAWWCPA